jgi:isoleucyl-tRNA synthetase
VLLKLSQIAAPFVPFISEAIYRNLRTRDMPESVHLCAFPEADPSACDPQLEQEMAAVMTTVRLGRALRAEHELKVRQPLQAMHVVSTDRETLRRLEPLQDLVLDELNVKQVIFGDNETDLAHLKAKANFKTVGPRFGARTRLVASAVAGMDGTQAEAVTRGDSVTLTVEGQPVTLDPEDVVVERIPKEGLVVASEGPILVALETGLSEPLLREGLAREFVNKVQNMRKQAALEVSQRIRIRFAATQSVREAVRGHSDYVKSETLCVDCVEESEGPEGGAAWDLNGESCVIRIDPA